MQIRDISTTAFKSDYYGLKKISQQYYLASIKTDNKPKEGKNLVLQYTDRHNKVFEEPMIYDGKYYTHNFGIVTSVNKYKILNKECDKEPKEIDFDEQAISRNAAIYDKISTGKPLVQNIAEGTTEGIIVTNKNNIPKEEPVILVLGKIDNSEQGVYSLVHLPENVKGLFVANANINILSHAGSLSSHYYDVMSVIFDDKVMESLRNLEGKKVSISNKNGNIDTKEIDKFSINRRKEVKTPTIPVLDNEEKLLEYYELTRKNSGEKAYRIAIMHGLSKAEILSDITIPAGFIVPTGYIGKIDNFLTEGRVTENDTEYKTRLRENPFIQEIKEKMEEHDIKTSDSIFRSAFNAEDLSDYPCAGIYDSVRPLKDYRIVETIMNIVNSRDSEAAKISRKRYNIPDCVIQPTVLIQEGIYPDYTFTTHTSDQNGRFRIEIGERDIQHTEPDMAVVTYDRNTKDIKLETSQNHIANYLVKDDGTVIEQELEEDRIQKEWNGLLAPLGILIAGALKLEKYFGAPQDIEGGIKQGKVYFWQTRDIIKKAVK